MSLVNHCKQNDSLLPVWLIHAWDLSSHYIGFSGSRIAEAKSDVRRRIIDKNMYNVKKRNRRHDYAAERKSKAQCTTG